jgi:RHS repeat-associated protein
VRTTYEVDANDRLTAETTGGATTLYTYDANGNTTGQAKPGELVTYGYDEANRRVRTTTSAGVITTGYHADGIRNRESAGGRVTTWLIDANRDYAQTLEAYSGGQLSTVWIYGNELLAQANVVGGGVFERSLHTDGMGSVRQATDASGQITDAFEYDAFGVELARTGTSDIDHRYRSEQVDPDTGFYNLRARWYGASAGRFLSSDMFHGYPSVPYSLHHYLYVGNDPVGEEDPSGNTNLVEISISINESSAYRTTNAAAARRTLKRFLLGKPPEDIGIIGETVLDYMLNGVFEELQAGTMTKQEFGRRAHSRLKSKIEVFKPLPGFTVVAEPFFIESRKGEPLKTNPKGSVGVDVFVMEGTTPVLAMELKTGEGYSRKGKLLRRKRTLTDLVQVSIIPVGRK